MPKNPNRFPGAVRLGEEIIEAPQEEINEGAPKSPEESVFNIPHVAKAADIALSLQKANSKEKKELIADICFDLIENPIKLFEFLDSLEILKEVESYKVDDLKNEILKGLEKVNVKKMPPSPEVLEVWLTTYVESALYGRLAENVLKKMVDRCRDTKSVVDLFYNMAVAAVVNSSNKQVSNKFVEIFARGTSILRAKSDQAVLLMAAFFDMDDVVLKKIMEIDSVVNWLSNFLPNGEDLYQQEQQDYEEIFEDQRFKKIFTTNSDKDYSRMEQLLSFHGKATNGTDVVALNPTKKNKFIIKALQTRGVLHDWYYAHNMDRFEAEYGAKPVSLYFLDRQSVIDPSDDTAVSRELYEMLDSPNPDNLAMSDPEHWDTLCFITPDNFKGEIPEQQIALLNERLRQDMKDNSHHLLSPRGDLVEFSPDLKKLGFESILFQFGPDRKTETLVTIKVLNYKYQILLDENFCLKDVKGKTGIRLKDGGEFLTNLIISHLREIRCTENVYEKGGSDVSGDQRKAFYGRRPHERILPVGHKPTQSQIVRIFEVYGIDIVRMNNERKARGEERQKTYVFEAQNIAIGGEGPIVSVAPEATRGLKEMIERNSKPLDK